MISEFHKALKSILNIDLPLQFSTLFLGSVDFQARRPDEYMFGILILACKNALTKLPEPTTVHKFIDIVNYIYIMEKITFSLRLQKNMFIKFWTEWIK